MKYLHIIAAIVCAFMAYPAYLWYGEWSACVCVLGVVANFVIVVVDDRKARVGDPSHGSKQKGSEGNA